MACLDDLPQELVDICTSNVLELNSLGVFACTSRVARLSVAQAAIWEAVCNERWPTAVAFINDLQNKHRGVGNIGPYYSLYCRRSRLPQQFTTLTDLVHSCTLACQYSESKKSFIKMQAAAGISHRIFQSTEVLLMQVLQASASLHKLTRAAPQLMRSREWQLFEQDLSWWLEAQTRAILTNKAISQAELKSLVNRLPPGMVHLSIVEKISQRAI